MANFEVDTIEVIGARVHNLKNISLSIPRGKLVVITGISGSGKSSIAFDTLFAEGQRRYLDTFSAYSRQFLKSQERPDVDAITGLSPVIAIAQKTINRNPRSTVGTITEIYDYLRLLYARAGEAFSQVTGKKMVRYSDDQICSRILKDYEGKTIVLLAPLVKGRKGHYRELFEQLRRSGFTKIRLDGKFSDLKAKMQIDRYKVHDIELLVDKVVAKKENNARIRESIMTALKQGKGSLLVLEDEVQNKAGKQNEKYFSRSLMCEKSGISYPEPAPNLFSFNSPYGACPQCRGLGYQMEVDLDKIITDPLLSIHKGALGNLKSLYENKLNADLEQLGAYFGFTLSTPFNKISTEGVHAILYGYEDSDSEGFGNSNLAKGYYFEGIANLIESIAGENLTPGITKWVQTLMRNKECKLCKGNRLKAEALNFKIDGKHIAEISKLNISELGSFFAEIEKRLNFNQLEIAREVIKEIRSRIGFLEEVGLSYLSLFHSSKTLSGGEAQRIRLASQIGSKLTGVLYILDEPSIGLHQRDNARLIVALKKLRDDGNSVVVVEHDKEMIMESDYVIDMGPGAGIHGGRVVAEGPPLSLLGGNGLTAMFLDGRQEVTPKNSRAAWIGHKKNKIILSGATGHNLKSVTLEIPLSSLICITGVSGSGKSSLITETLYPILSLELQRSEATPLPYTSFTGMEHLNKVIKIDQDPIGRSPKSNPATYTKLFDEIRILFAATHESAIRGYKPGRFSFNVSGGRCETCGGGGLKVVEMNFLPDVYVQCEDCLGKRYNKETLEVRYKGKSINDVLEMSVETAENFFLHIPPIHLKLKALLDVGLGYITLGQQAVSLSGGEAQRVKLAAELSKRATGKTLYILDEPTTGLHFEDIRMLLKVLHRLVDEGNTVIVIEHNLDVVRAADFVVDMGPEGGAAGGNIIFSGTPDEMIKSAKSFTGKFLKKEMLTFK